MSEVMVEEVRLCRGGAGGDVIECARMCARVCGGCAGRSQGKAEGSNIVCDCDVCRCDVCAQVQSKAKFAPEAGANLKPGAMVPESLETNRQVLATRLQQLGKVCDALVDG